MNKRIELHEVLKIAEILGIFWEIKTYEELTELILQETNSKTILDAIYKSNIDRAAPQTYFRSKTKVDTTVSETFYIGWVFDQSWKMYKRLKLWQRDCLYLPLGIHPNDLGLELLGDQPATSTPQTPPDGASLLSSGDKFGNGLAPSVPSVEPPN